MFTEFSKAERLYSTVISSIYPSDYLDDFKDELIADFQRFKDSPYPMVDALRESWYALIAIHAV